MGRCVIYMLILLSALLGFNNLSFAGDEEDRRLDQLSFVDATGGYDVLMDCAFPVTHDDIDSIGVACRASSSHSDGSSMAVEVSSEPPNMAADEWIGLALARMKELAEQVKHKPLDSDASMPKYDLVFDFQSYLDPATQRSCGCGETRCNGASLVSHDKCEK